MFYGWCLTGLCLYIYTVVVYTAVAQASLAISVFFKPASCHHLRHFLRSRIIVPLAIRHNSIWIRKLLDKFFFSNSISKTCFNYLDLLPNVQTFVSGANLLKLLVIVELLHVQPWWLGV